MGADGDGRITQWNAGAERLLGYSRAEIAGEYVRTLVRDEHFENQHAPLRRVLAGERVERIETHWVRKDGALLARVFQNLLADAVKFRGDAAPVVAVSAARSPREWTLTVAGNGPAVSERNRDRIFELFARAQVDGEAPGTGLGLAVCRKVVELHGGRIWVEPAPGGGGAFRMTLPV